MILMLDIGVIGVIVTIVCYIITVYIGMKKKYNLTFKHGTSLYLDTIKYLLIGFLISYCTGELVGALVNWFIKDLEIVSILGEPTHKFYIWVFSVLTVVYPLVNILTYKQSCGEYYKEFKTNRVISSICIATNVIYNYIVYKCSITLSTSIEIDNNTRNTCVGGVVFCIALIILLCGLKLINGNVYSEEQYTAFEIGIDEGVIYKLHKDDIIRVNKDKDILIINNEEGKYKVDVIDVEGLRSNVETDSSYPIYVKHEHIKYIKDYKGNIINY